MRAILLSLLYAAALAAQAPDCQFTSSFTNTTPSAAVASKSSLVGGTPCIYWVFTYWTNNATGVSIQLEGTNDAGGTAGASFTALTPLSASYPNPAIGTDEGGSILCCDSYPWVRLNPGTFTGTNQTMTVRVYGWRTPLVSTGAGGAGSNVTIVGPLGQALMAASIPVVVASNQSAIAVGGTAGTPFATDSKGDIALMCSNPALTKQVTALFTVSGAQRLVTAVAAQTTRFCHIHFSTATPETVTFLDGTGAACAGGTPHTLDAIINATAAAFDYQGNFTTALPAYDFCVNPSASQNIQVTAIYVQF